ncbi:uncharacterized protein LOC129619282 [Condylostylus longicornis]|uniref:uncharacterized protein LOC129619282 n=1 Tax=Condylostylus longicornis TaxID=2530218 RepID=UPI00244DEC0E|nr:uncharacterized protein LOC129619282 [Condylostylus longicornis]
MLRGFVKQNTRQPIQNSCNGEMNYDNFDSDMDLEAEYFEESDDYTNEDEFNVRKDKSFVTEEEREKKNERKKNRRIWENIECTKRLLELYKKFNPKVGRCGQFTKKHQMYKYMAKKINEEFGLKYTGDQVASRVRKFVSRKDDPSKLNDFDNRSRNSKFNTNSEIDISNYNLESMFDSEDDEKCSEADNERNEQEGSSSKAEFTNQQSKKLIKLYNMFVPNVGCNGQFRTKKEMFKAISEEMQHEFNVKYTPLQVESRYRNIRRKARNIISRANQLNSIEQKINKNRLEYIDTSSAKLTHDSDLENDSRDGFMLKNEFVDEDDDYSSFHQKPVKVETQILEDDEESSSCKTEIDKDDVELNKIENLAHKIFKFCDKDLMKEYLKFKEKKMKIEEIRHNEIMEQLRKMNQTLLEIQQQNY